MPFSQTESYNPRHPDVLATNPNRQVPVLLDGDLAVFESTVISNISRTPIRTRRHDARRHRAQLRAEPLRDRFRDPQHR
ncbi:hypothetical protein M1D34_29130 (plasmid) [Ensifer sp. D2-11]